MTSGRWNPAVNRPRTPGFAITEDEDEDESTEDLPPETPTGCCNPSNHTFTPVGLPPSPKPEREREREPPTPPPPCWPNSISRLFFFSLLLGNSNPAHRAPRPSICHDYEPAIQYPHQIMSNTRGQRRQRSTEHVAFVESHGFCSFPLPLRPFFFFWPAAPNLSFPDYLFYTVFFWLTINFFFFAPFSPL